VIVTWNESTAAIIGPAVTPTLPEIELLPHVQPERGVGTRRGEHAVLDHRARASADLFGRLEAQHGTARERRRTRDELAGNAEQDRGVTVVPARVHRAGGLRAIRNVVLLGDRQRVHVGAQQHGLPGTALRAGDDGRDAGARDRGARLEPERAQPVRDQARGAALLERELGMRVQVAARLDDRADLFRCEAGGRGHRCCSRCITCCPRCSRDASARSHAAARPCSGRRTR
jgi:hypothetical protein